MSNYEDCEKETRVESESAFRWAMHRAGVGDQVNPGEFLALILLIFLNKAAEKLASNFLKANLLSPVKRTDYSSDVVPFGPIAAAASTLIKEVVSRVAVPWSKVEAKHQGKSFD
jgi:hypothetical protein